MKDGASVILFCLYVTLVSRYDLLPSEFQSEAELHRITVKEELITLQVLAVEAGDVGSYQCVVENEVGRASCDCQVTLKGCLNFILVEPPSFVQKLENLSLLVGKEVSLRCTLKGSEPMTVSWLKDNHELKEAENIQITYENQTALLHINHLQSKHGGKYSCQVQNQAGSQTCSAVLTVSNDVGQSFCEATLTVLGQFLMCSIEPHICFI
uniref:Ig-like domain-containing protein n=1 Tax=Scophthalmus maximus TaxID=52904 RepID=A0A8D3CP74_SCOMX